MNKVPLTIVVAVADNGVIGRDNALPWRLRTDLRRFKDITIGKPLIMGRRNWDSIGRALPGRRTIVLTRDTAWQAEGAAVAHTWDEAKALSQRFAHEMAAEEAIVAGGAEIYRLALADSERIRITEVHASVAGQTVFPAFDRAAFVETFRERHPASEPDDAFPFSFVDLDRRPATRQA